MNRHLSLTIAAAFVALSALSAQAATVSIIGENTTVMPTTTFIMPPASSVGNFIQSTTTTVPNVQKSPFEGTSSAGSAYSVVGSGSGFGSATYNMTGGTTAFTFLWGSPDTYNTLDFFSGANGTGSVLGTFTGASLALATLGSGFDVVSFMATGGTIGSFRMTDTTAAFEYAGVSPIPLPPAAALFGTALLGMMALRRKRRQQAVAA